MITGIYRCNVGVVVVHQEPVSDMDVFAVVAVEDGQDVGVFTRAAKQRADSRFVLVANQYVMPLSVWQTVTALSFRAFTAGSAKSRGRPALSFSSSVMVWCSGYKKTGRSVRFASFPYALQVFDNVADAF